jgi:hypothetical protein
MATLSCLSASSKLSADSVEEYTKLSREYNFGSYSSNTIRTLHEAEMELLRFNQKRLIVKKQTSGH